MYHFVRKLWLVLGGKVVEIWKKQLVLKFGKTTCFPGSGFVVGIKWHNFQSLLFGKEDSIHICNKK